MWSESRTSARDLGYCAAIVFSITSMRDFLQIQMMLNTVPNIRSKGFMDDTKYKDKKKKNTKSKNYFNTEKITYNIVRGNNN